MDCTYFSVPGNEEAIHFPLPACTLRMTEEIKHAKCLEHQLETKLTFVRLENADIVHGSSYAERSVQE